LLISCTGFVFSLFGQDKHDSNTTNSTNISRSSSSSSNNRTLATFDGSVDAVHLSPTTNKVS
jgi:hypothetical protein